MNATELIEKINEAKKDIVANDNIPEWNKTQILDTLDGKILMIESIVEEVINEEYQAIEIAEVEENFNSHVKAINNKWPAK
jgi:hypothetical protein